MVFSIENQGVSNARNYGKNIASGDYMIFVDSDDYLEQETFEKCIKIIRNSNADILKFGFKRKCGIYCETNLFETETDILIKKDRYDEKIYNNILSTSDFYNVWNTFIKSDIAKRIDFEQELKFGEDYFFIVQCVLQSNSIYMCSDVLYNYEINLSSATQNYEVNKIKEKINNILLVNYKIINMLGYLNIKIDKNSASNQITKLINVDFINLSDKVKYKEYCQIIDSITRNDYYKKLIESKYIIKENESKIKQKRYFYKNKIIKKIKNVQKNILVKLF